MAFRITITQEADSHLAWLTAREQHILKAAVIARLTNQPMVLSRAIKRLRPNPLAEFELRVGNLRVLYNVETENSEVVLLVVGGEEFHGHQHDSPKSASDGPAGSPE